MYTYIHTFHIYTHIYIYVYTHILIHIHTYICIHAKIKSHYGSGAAPLEQPARCSIISDSFQLSETLQTSIATNNGADFRGAAVDAIGNHQRKLYLKAHKDHKMLVKQ